RDCFADTESPEYTGWSPAASRCREPTVHRMDRCTAATRSPVCLDGGAPSLRDRAGDWRHIPAALPKAGAPHRRTTSASATYGLDVARRANCTARAQPGHD